MAWTSEITHRPADVSPGANHVVGVYVDRIRPHLIGANESVLRIGDELIAAKAELPHGQFASVLEALGLSRSHAHRFMSVSDRFANVPPGGHLPFAITTLAELARLDDDELAEAIESGAVNPSMTRADAQALVRGGLISDDELEDIERPAVDIPVADPPRPSVDVEVPDADPTPPHGIERPQIDAGDPDDEIVDAEIVDVRPPVTGLDGKTYPRPTKPPAPRRRPITDFARDAGWDVRKAIERIERIVEDDRFAANKEQVALHLRNHLLYVNEAYQRLIQTIGEEPT